jgi:hypothetical protein
MWRVFGPRFDRAAAVFRLTYDSPICRFLQRLPKVGSYHGVVVN